MTVKAHITCLDDNSVQVGTGYWGEHGVSYLIEVPAGKILFDTGATPEVIAHNVSQAKIELAYAKYIVLSHAHPAHTGGLDWVLSQTRDPMIIADPEIFAKKSVKGEKDFVPFGMRLKQEQISSRARLNLTKDVYNIAAGVAVSGRIPRVTPYEIPEEKYLVEQDGMLDIDPFYDDRSLILDTEKGLVVITGCCHVGITNTLVYALKTFARPIAALIGGIHLSDASMEKVVKTLTPIREKLKPQAVYLTHCTGAEPFQTFRSAMGSVVKGFPVGTTLTF